GKITNSLTGELIPDALETRELENTAFEDFKKGEEVSAEAKEDLEAALKQGPCLGPVEDRLNKLLREAADDDKVRKLVDSWQAAGSNDLYIVNQQLVSEDAAL